MVDLQDIFSTAGTITAFGLSLSPSIPFMKVLKGKEKIDTIPEGRILFLMLTRLVWTSIWIITERKMALLNTCLSITLCNVFLSLYSYIYFNKNRLKVFITTLTLLVIEGVLLLGMVLWGDYLILSYIAMVCKIIMSISPGQRIVRVVKEKNYKLIPIYSTITNFLCSLSWFCYGICIKLLGQIISNLIGLIFSIANTAIWIYFYIKKKEKEKGEVLKEEENEEKEKDKEKKDKEIELTEK